MGTVGTSLFALAVAAFLGSEVAPWLFPVVVATYCVVYAGAVITVLAIRHGGWKWETKWIHVLPAVIWAVAVIAACEFTFFVICTNVASREW